MSSTWITGGPEVEADGSGGDDLAGRNGSELCGDATMLRDRHRIDALEIPA
jgi:hypothetical protein